MPVIRQIAIAVRGPRAFDNPLVFPVAGFVVPTDANKILAVTVDMIQSVRDDPNTTLDYGVWKQNLDGSWPVNADGTPVKSVGGLFEGHVNGGRGGTPTPAFGVRCPLQEYQGRTIRLFAWMPNGLAVEFGATISVEPPAA